MVKGEGKEADRIAELEKQVAFLTDKLTNIENYLVINSKQNEKAHRERVEELRLLREQQEETERLTKARPVQPIKSTDGIDDKRIQKEASFSHTKNTTEKMAAKQLAHDVQKQNLEKQNKRSEAVSQGATTEAEHMNEATATKQERQPQPKMKQEVSMETLLSVWLPRVFMFILILGVLWGLKISIDNGWISYTVRIILGYLATGLLLYLGLRYVNRRQKIFGITLLSGVIVLGILVTMAGYYLYGFFNYYVATAIALVYIIGGFILSKKFKSETLIIFTAIAGFLLPFLIAGNEVNTITFCIYLLVIFLTLFYTALRDKHKVSYYIIYFTFHITLLIYTLDNLLYDEEPIIVGTALIQHLLLLFFYVKGSISRRVFTEAIMYTNVVFMLGWIKLLEDPQEIIVYGVFALLYILLTLYAFSQKDEGLQGVFSAVAVFAVSVFILAFNLDAYENKLTLLLINGAIGLWVGFRFKTMRTIIISSLIYFLTGWTVITVVYIDKVMSLAHVTWLIFIVTIIFIYRMLYQLGVKQFSFKRNNLDFSLIAGQIIGLIYLFHLTHTVFAEGYYTQFIFEHFVVLVMMIALVLSYMAYQWRHGKYIAAVAVIEFLILGLVLLTMPLNPDMFTIKTTFLFNLAVQIIYVVLLVGLFIQLYRKRAPILEKLQGDIAGYATGLQLVLLIFFNKWYFSLTYIYSWERDYVFIGHTLWLFLFAFISLSIGNYFKWKIVRIIAVSLIGICILKLFFIDLITISLVIRAILFIVVGIIGLVFSRTLLKSS